MEPDRRLASRERRPVNVSVRHLLLGAVNYCFGSRLCENSGRISRTLDSAKFAEEIRSESNPRSPKVQRKSSLAAHTGFSHSLDPKRTL